MKPRRATRLVSALPGDATVPVLLRVIRGGRWVVSLSTSGRLVVWDTWPHADHTDRETREVAGSEPVGRPVARFQLACVQLSLESRTVAWDEDDDACGAVVAITHTNAG